MPEIGFLHIGKTGGNSISHIRNCLDVKSDEFRVFGHRFDAQSIFSEHQDIKIGCVVRDPIERATSGFYSRLRQGRPKNQILWRPAEAIAFQYFSSLNDLAEALSSSDERLKSAALYALNAITHIKRGYQHHFHSVHFVKEHQHRFYCVCQIEHLDARLHDFFSPLGIAEADVRRHQQRRHVADYPSAHAHSSLTSKARDNLRFQFKKEYDIYDFIVRELC